MVTIRCKYNRFLLFPHNAISNWFDIGEIMTSDGKVCKPRFIAGWRNEGEQYYGILDELCQEHYQMSFPAIRSIWISRLGSCDEMWHLVEMIEK